MKADFLIASEAAKILGCSPQLLRDTAHNNPSGLGFPVVVVGKRVLIPKLPFYKYLGLEETK